MGRLPAGGSEHGVGADVHILRVAYLSGGDCCHGLHFIFFSDVRLNFRWAKEKNFQVP